jgi:tetratricopeptide (TPR) repeat protein
MLSIRLFVPFIFLILFSSCSLKFKKFEEKQVVEKDEVAVLLEEGNLLFKQDQFEAALLKFVQAKAIDASRPLVNYNLGACYFSMEKYPEAIKAFSDELIVNKRDAYAYLFRGHAYTKIGLYDNAMADAELSLQITDHAMAYYIIGLVYLNKGQYQLALDKFNAAIYKDPLDYLFYVDRGNAYVLLEKTDKACADYTQAKRIRPNIDLSKEMVNCQ